MKNTTTTNNTYTAFLVRDTNARRYLNQKVYSGRVPGIWGKMGESHIFYTEAQAQNCASNINRRRPARYSAYNAVVVPVEIRRRNG